MFCMGSVKLTPNSTFKTCEFYRMTDFSIFYQQKLLLDIEYSRYSRNKHVIHVEFIQYASVHSSLRLFTLSSMINYKCLMVSVNRGCLSFIGSFEITLTIPLNLVVLLTDCDINNLFSERAINDAFEHAKNAKLDKAEGNQQSRQRWVPKLVYRKLKSLNNSFLNIYI